MITIKQIKERYLSEYHNKPLTTLFITVMLAFVLVFLIEMILTKGDVLNYTLFWNRHDCFMDLFNSAYDSMHGPYTDKNVIYPPFAVMVYYIIGSIITSIEGDITAFEMRDSITGLITVTILTVVVLIALIIVIGKCLKDNNNRIRWITTLCIVFSLPVLYAIDRGNNILYAVLFSLIFVINYKSEDKKLRFISYVALGIATGLKIYPAILWLLIVQTKNWKESIICAITVAIIFIVPFIFFENSISFVTNILSYNSGHPEGMYTIKDTIYQLFCTILPTNIVNILGWVLTFLLLVATIQILFWTNAENWKKIALLCCNLSIGFGVGTAYLCCYMIIAAVFFLKHETCNSQINIAYSVMLAISMAVFGLYIKESYTYLITTSFKALVIITFTGLLIYSIYKSNPKHTDKEVIQK